jgi:hypothetical protein
MAAGINIDELRASLKSPDAIRRNPFALLKSLALLAADSQNESVAVELTLWALENQGSFGAAGAILNSVVQAVGLHPYVDPEPLGAREQLAYEFHRPIDFPGDTVFHRVQATVYRRLMDGENVVLSAPTSFGKSLLIDAMVASGKFENIAVIVPTLALMDETRRRLARFSDSYKLVTHLSQKPAAKNIFILTAERASAFAALPRIDFFVIDEFYKLGDAQDSDRMVMLNSVFYRLLKGGGQFYLLGPSIREIPVNAEQTLQCRFIHTNFATVVSEVIRVKAGQDELAALVQLCQGLEEPTLVFCRSPARVNEVARLLVENNVGGRNDNLVPAASWIGSAFHPDWIFGQALLTRVGIHHGKLPRSLAQFAVRAFNEGNINFLICTSTLIEGVNTKAKNVIVFDNEIARQKIDFFEYSNIKGRSGRMFQHFVGRVFLFHDPPAEQLPVVELPVVTQQLDTPTSLLLNIDSEDLTGVSRDRLSTVLADDSLPLGVLKGNTPIPPEAQLRLAKEIAQSPWDASRYLSWEKMPNYAQLAYVCDLIWRNLIQGRSRGGVRSAKQLALKIFQLQNLQDVSARVRRELKPGNFQAKSADEAVERVLDFDRTWSFEFPKFLMALDRIQKHVLGIRKIPFGDYRFYASSVECLFRSPVIAALEEYGIPIQVTERLIGSLGSSKDLDMALARLRQLDIRKFMLTEFETNVVEDAQKYI